MQIMVLNFLHKGGLRTDPDSTRPVYSIHHAAGKTYVNAHTYNEYTYRWVYAHGFNLLTQLVRFLHLPSANEQAMELALNL